MNTRMQGLFFASLICLGVCISLRAQNSLDEPIVFDQKANASISVKSNLKTLPVVVNSSNETKQNAQANVVVNPKLGTAYQLSNDKAASKDGKANGEQFRVATWSLSRF